MNNLKTAIQELVNLNEKEWEELKEELKPTTFKAKHAIIKQGKTASNLYYIESGLIRTYHIIDGKEINTYFACSGQFISSFSSFITQTPSFEFLETIEESKVYSISYQALTSLYQKSAKFEKIGRIIAEKNYLCILDRTITMQTKTAKEKYLDFIKTYHKIIVQRVPQYQIASFLGIAPESLSRVRKEISIS